MKRFKLIFLIDDNQVDNFINEYVLVKADLAESIIVKTSAIDALEYLKTATNAFPDIIFLDIRMPIMDGFGFLKEFETLPEEKKKSVKIFLLSSSKDYFDIEKAENNARITKFIQKPLDVSQLEL
jgi:CheY-like chemotaxis protein